jgi:hypothetical protein
MALGMELQTLLKLLVADLADLGLSLQPFQVSYEHYGDWVTTRWLKWVREKVGHFGFALLVHNLVSTFPRDEDNWLMSQFIAAGYKGTELQILNRVKNYQQVLFLSDILGAGGRAVCK